MNLLEDVQSRWKQLGTFLNVKTQNIDRGAKCCDLMLETFQKWIDETKTEERTIVAIIKALESGVIGNNSLAKKIREDPEIQTIYGYQPPPTGRYVISVVLLGITCCCLHCRLYR